MRTRLHSELKIQKGGTRAIAGRVFVECHREKRAAATGRLTRSSASNWRIFLLHANEKKMVDWLACRPVTGKFAG